MTAPRRYWHDMTTAEFGQLDAERVIAVLPVGAIEQHGPHLPVYVDACINQGIVERAVEMMPDELPAVILPAMPVGKSNEHLAFPGTLSLSAETLIRLWTEIGDCVANAGVRKIVLFNSHGGQPQIVDIVARDLRVRRKMLAVLANWYHLVDPSPWFDAEEIAYGIHGGGIETSMMLHLRPDLVQMDKAEDFRPTTLDMVARYKHLRPHGKVAFGWQTQDLHPAGAAGDATDADVERGKALVDGAAAGLVSLLQDIDAMPLSALRDGPLD